jgi:hypothetical protein
MIMTPTSTPTRRPLIAGVLRAPVTRTLGTAAAAPRPAEASAQARSDGFTPSERHAVRTALADGRDTDERAIDHVVDRLLRELTW